MRIPYLFFLIVSLTFSQNKLTKSDVIGKWQIKVNIKQLLKEETKDLDMFEKMAVQLASGLAEDILDTADIYILFKKNNTALLTLNFLDYDEEEEVKWSIVGDEIVIDDSLNKKINIGSENNKFLNLGFLTKNSDFSVIVFPFGFSTPETITSPTSPAA